MCQACEQKLTVEQVLSITTNILRSINVPVELVESIGIPVSNAIKNISLCINALEEAKIVREDKEDGNAETEERTDD